MEVRKSAEDPNSCVIKRLSDGVELYHVDGKHVSVNGVRTMYDTKTGEALYSLTLLPYETQQHMVLHDIRQKVDYTMHKKGFLPGFGRGTVLVWKGPEDVGDALYEMTSDLMRRTGTIFENESRKVLGAIERPVFENPGPGGVDHYSLKVVEGGDMAFVAMLSICFDEQYTEGIQYEQ